MENKQKIIGEDQCKAVLDLIQKYNVGVNDFIAVQTMFSKLKNFDGAPLLEDVKK